jgi:putative transposase
MHPRRDVLLKGNFYHIYNRGVDKNRIFFNSANYEFLLRLFKRYRDKYRVTIIAYCLMPNRYHLMVRQDENIPLYRFVRPLFNSYVQAVNRQQDRKGSLFEGK